MRLTDFSRTIFIENWHSFYETDYYAQLIFKSIIILPKDYLGFSVFKLIFKYVKEQLQIQQD